MTKTMIVPLMMILAGCGGVLQESPDPLRSTPGVEVSEIKPQHEFKLWVDSTTQKALYLRSTESCMLRLLISLAEKDDLMVKLYRRDTNGVTTLAEVLSSDSGFIMRDVSTGVGEQIVLEFFSTSPNESPRRITTWVECLNEKEDW